MLLFTPVSISGVIDTGVNSNIIMAIGTGDKKALVKVLVIHL